MRMRDETNHKNRNEVYFEVSWEKKIAHRKITNSPMYFFLHFKRIITRWY